MKSLLRRAAAGCVALLGTLGPGMPATSASAAPAAPVLRWVDCGDGFQCADARVPLDYDNPYGPTITIALIRKLDGQPLPTGDPAHPRLSGDDIRQAALAAMYTPRLWRDFAAALTAAAAGQPSAMLDFLAEQDGSGTYDQRFAVLAVDQRFPRGPVAVYGRASVHAYRMFPHFWWVNGLVNLDLAQWPVEDGDAFRGRIHNPDQAAPILVISNTHDPATPYAGARQLVADLGNARLLTHQADGHASLTSGNPCLVGPALAYLTDGITLPPAGATCRDDTDPFAP